MIVMSDVIHDARVTREARTLMSAGHEVTLIGLEPAFPAELPSELNVRWARAASPFPSGRPAPRVSRLRDAARWLLLPSHVSRLTSTFHVAARELAAGLEYDVVHAHDFNTLELSAELAARADVPFVYDSHECWLGRKRQARPTPFADRRTARLEAELGSRAHAVITVSEGVAEWLSGRYGWDHVTLVRNTFPARDQPAPLASEPTGLLFAGGIGKGRELEALAGAAGALPLPVTLIGPQDAAFAASLGPAVRVRPPIPIDDVDAELRQAGLALVLLADGPLNHQLALPNKLFQAVRAGVPVVATDLPEIRRVVTRHRLGTLYRAGDRRSLIDAVKRAIDEFETHAESVLSAADALSWQRDGDRLVGIYRSLQTGE